MASCGLGEDGLDVVGVVGGVGRGGGAAVVAAAGGEQGEENEGGGGGAVKTAARTGGQANFLSGTSMG